MKDEFAEINSHFFSVLKSQVRFIPTRVGMSDQVVLCVILELQFPIFDASALWIKTDSNYYLFITEGIPNYKSRQRFGSMGCMESKQEVVPVDQGVHRDAKPIISHLRGTQSYTYTFHDRGSIPTNYTVPQITVTETYAIGTK